MNLDGLEVKERQNNSENYSPVGNCRRPTLIQNGSQISGAMLKNSATLIRAKRENFVADA